MHVVLIMLIDMYRKSSVHNGGLLVQPVKDHTKDRNLHMLESNAMLLNFPPLFITIIEKDKIFVSKAMSQINFHFDDACLHLSRLYFL